MCYVLNVWYRESPEHLDTRSPKGTASLKIHYDINMFYNDYQGLKLKEKSFWLTREIGTENPGTKPPNGILILVHIE